MATSFEIVPATEEHARELAPWLRAEDAAEVFASHGYGPEEAVLDALRMSDVTKAAIVDGEVAAIFGVASLSVLGGVGSIWMLTGEAVNEKPMAFLRRCHREVGALLEDWPVLVNFVDARYTRCLRWATWLGFEVGEPIPFGRAGMPFHPIVLRRQPCASLSQ